MKYLRLKLFLILLNSILVDSQCKLDGLHTATPPIFLNMTTPKNITLLKTPFNDIKMKDTDKIVAYCAKGMNSKIIFEKTLNLECEKENLTINAEATLQNGTKLSYTEVKGLTCTTPNRFEIFMKVGYGGCSHNYYPVGIILGDERYEFLQICFDLRGMIPVFVRFVARKEIPDTLSDFITLRALDNTQVLWDTDERYKTAQQRRLTKLRVGHYVELELPNYNFFISTGKYKGLIDAILAKYKEIIVYNEEGLYPVKHFGSDFGGIIETSNKLQTVVGWEPLFKGNWNIFLTLLKERLKEESYDVYIGTSHITKAPKDLSCVDLGEAILKDSGKSTPIPKFVWAFLVNEQDRFVIVGVNSPYYPVWDSTDILPCTSTCHLIPWLHILDLYSRTSTFGLIYCCPVTDVDHFLHGFPKYY